MYPIWYTISGTINSILYLISDALFWSAKTEVITGSEFIVKANAERNFLTATAINDLIKNVLKNPQFNLEEVDTDMLQRLSRSIDSDSGDLNIISIISYSISKFISSILMLIIQHSISKLYLRYRRLKTTFDIV